MKSKIRYAVFFLAMCVLLCLLLISCNAKESGKLRICFDIGLQNDMQLGGSFQQEAASGFAEAVAVQAGLQGRELSEIEVEVIPSDPESADEREATLQRLRTEIMTGGGPDVFIACTEGTHRERLDSSRLFPYLSKSIADGIFLPLDSYMEQFQMVSQEELIQPVLAGGRDSQGQQVIVPLCFSIPSLIWEQKEVDPSAFVGKTWQDVLSSQDSLLAEQLRWLWPTYTFSSESMRKNDHDTGLSYIYPDLLDQVNKEVGMTEEDLAGLLLDSLPALGQLLGQEPEALSWSMFFSRMLDNAMFPNPETIDLAVVPVRNQQGGATAVVSMCCGVNANTQRPEEAAFVVEYLLSTEYQSTESGGLFQINNGFASPSKLINKNGFIDGDTKLAAATLESWHAACGQVNQVYFPSPADSVLNDMMEAIQQEMLATLDGDVRKDEFLYGDISEERLREIVHEYYGQISRLLEES